jgi:hypothetical protein
MPHGDSLNIGQGVFFFDGSDYRLPAWNGGMGVFVIWLSTIENVRLGLKFKHPFKKNNTGEMRL